MFLGMWGREICKYYYWVAFFTRVIAEKYNYEFSNKIPFKCQKSVSLACTIFQMPSHKNYFKIVYCTCFQVPKRTYFTISSDTWAYLLLMSMDSLTDTCYQKFSFSRKFAVVITLDISILYFFSLLIGISLLFVKFLKIEDGISLWTFVL